MIAVASPPGRSRSAECASGGVAPRIGALAHGAIREATRRLLEAGASLARDLEPDALHDMRVAARRLQAALRLFDFALALPVGVSRRRIRTLTRRLGTLRDHQLASARLDAAGLHGGARGNRNAEGDLRRLLGSERHERLIRGLKRWVRHPRFTTAAELEAPLLLPDLLLPDLCRLFRHPAWTLPRGDESAEALAIVHDLRKRLKRIRYRAECCTQWYGEDFACWVERLELLQDTLGQVHDSDLVLSALGRRRTAGASREELRRVVLEERSRALDQWDQVRRELLDPACRRRLRQMLLAPLAEPTVRFTADSPPIRHT